MKKLSVAAKMGYGTGGMAFSVKDVAFQNFVLFFYTVVVGLTGKQAGLVLMIAMLWDAFSDPIIGSFSDNFRSRWGRRHPFMLLGGIPYSLTFLALFYPPMEWSSTGKFWWMLVTCLLLRTFLTVFTIPHTSLAPELSNDYHERSSIIGFRSVMGWINGVILYVIVVAIFLRTVPGADGEPVDGRMVAANYHGYAILSVILVIVYTTIATFSTWKFIPQLRSAAGDAKRFNPMQILHDLRWALKNHNFRVMCIMMLTGATATGVDTTLRLIMLTYFWEFSTDQLAVLGLVQLVGVIFMFALLRPLGKRFDKHRLIQFCYVVFSINIVWMIALRLMGVIPENGHWLVFALFILNSFIWAVFIMLFGVMASSFTADIVDEQEYNTGRRQEGVFYAAEAFAAKSVTGFGNMLGGFALDFVKFPTKAVLGRETMPSDVSDEVLFRLGIFCGPVLALTFMIPFGLSLLLRLTRERHDEIKAALELRRAEPAGESPTETDPFDPES